MVPGALIKIITSKAMMVPKDYHLEGDDGTWSFNKDYHLEGDDGTWSFNKDYHLSGDDGTWNFNKDYHLSGDDATWSDIVQSHHSVTDYENGILAGHREWTEDIPVSGDNGHWETDFNVNESGNGN